MSLPIIRSRMFHAVAAFVVGAVYVCSSVVSAHAATPEQLRSLQAQLQSVSAQLQQLAAPQAEVLGASTTARVRPACILLLDKKSYTTGSPVTVTWLTTGGAAIEFIALSDSSFQGFPKGKLSANGSQQVTASDLGLQYLTLRVTSPTGNTVQCTRYFTVTAVGASSKDVRISALFTTLSQLQNRMEELQSQYTAIGQSIDAVEKKISDTNAAIDRLKATSSPSSAVSIILRPNADAPRAATLSVSDKATSDWMDIFHFDLVNKTTQKASISQLALTVMTSLPPANVIADAKLVVDTVTLPGVIVTDPSTAQVTFKVKGGLVITADQIRHAKLQLRFKPLTQDYEGVTVRASVAGDQLQGVQGSGSVVGDTMVLRTKGLVVSVDTRSADLTSGAVGQHDYVRYVIKFDVTALNQDVYVAKNPGESVNFMMVNSGGVAVDSSASTVIEAFDATADADVTGKYFVVPEGSTKSFKISVKWTPGKASPAEALQLSGLYYGETAAPATNKWTAAPAKDFRTDAVATNI